MDAEHQAEWHAADALFGQWLELEEPQREAWLAALEIEERVRQRLEQMLAAHHNPHPSLDFNGMGSGLTGRHLGGWTLESELGRGGMAVVYRAWREHGMARQQAAIKILTLGALGVIGRERFQREAGILARLNHPNITALVDSGIAEDGTCWLAMPLVEGLRISDWCETQSLDAHATVRLYLQVCDAVAYAHRNLVIHRDLKPSNVLVDAGGHVRLLDFGIGQFTDSDDERTQTMWRAMTPGYAAPEQLRGASPSTAIDVYGLGALLHRLLTGRTPQTTTDGSESTQPSLLVRAADDAYHRHYVPLKNDLDRVLLKALAEEPEQRYPTAEALADDLRRWLDGQPVLAQRPKVGYRVRKFVTRNKVGVAASVLLAASLGAGAAATLWQASEARQQAELTRQEAENARVQAQRAILVRNFLEQVFTSTQPSAGDMPSAMDLLDEGARKARTELQVSDPLAAADILMLTGNARYNLGRFEQALEDFEEALRLADSQGDDAARERARIHWELGRLHRIRGNADTAIDHVRQSVALNEQWDATLNDRLRPKVSLGHLLVIAEPLAAEKIYREVLGEIAGTELEGSVRHSNALEGLATAITYGYPGPPEEVLAIGEERLGIVLAREGEDSDDYAQTLGSVAMDYRLQARHERAEELARHAVQVSERIFREPHFAKAAATCGLATILRYNGKFAEALPYFETANAINAALDRTDFQAEGCIRDTAYTRGTLGHYQAALEDLERSKVIIARHGRLETVSGMNLCGLQASMQIRLGQLGQAERTLAACAKVAADVEPATDYLQARAELLFARGDMQGAEQDLAKIRETERPNGVWSDWKRAWMLWLLIRHHAGDSPSLASLENELGEYVHASHLSTCLGDPNEANCLALP